MASFERRPSAGTPIRVDVHGHPARRVQRRPGRERRHVPERAFRWPGRPSNVRRL
jgi:hypothetical protein